MDYFLTYLVLRLDHFYTATLVTAIITAVVFAVTTIALAVNQKNKEDLGLTKPWFRAAGIVFCVFMVLSAIIPDTKQAAVIYCLPKIVNNEQVQKIPDNLLRLANSWIDEAVNKAEEVIPENSLDDTNSTNGN